MSLGLIQGLRDKHPHALIHVLVVPWCQAVYQLSSSVDQTILIDVGHGQMGLGIRWRVAQTLKKESYDEAYILPNSWKSALIPFLARIPKRIGYWGEGRWGLLTHGKKKPKNLPLLVQRYQHLAELSPDSIEPRLSVTMSPDTAKKLKDDWKINPDLPIIALCPGAEYGPAKRWPTTNFAQTIRDYGQKGWQGVILGSPKDGEVANEIIQSAEGHGINLVGKTSLKEAMEILSMAKLVVTNDSGLMHVAAAFNLPTIAIFGSSSPTYTPPLSKHARVVYQGVSCSPCFLRQCPLQGEAYLHCLTAITPEHIYPIAESMEK